VRVACSKCQKMVDAMNLVRDHDRQTTRLVVTCHGEKDEMEFPDQWVADNQDFATMIQAGLVLGWAFTGKDGATEPQ
jgi:hypothetical protein